MIRALALLAALAAAGPAAGATDPVFDHPADRAQLERDLAPAIATLRAARVLRGAYAQEKRLHELPRPLLADGTFLFARGVGIAWRTVRPFESELVITDREIVQRDSGGVALRLSAEQQPGVRTVAGVFAAVFALDFDALQSLFDLYSRRSGAGWELGLRPRPGMAGAIRQITVGGRQHVERVRLSDTRGDETDIRLRDTSVSAEDLSAEEQRRFNP